MKSTILSVARPKKKDDNAGVPFVLKGGLSARMI